MIRTVTNMVIMHEEKSVSSSLGNVDLNHFLPPKHDGYKSMADPVNVSNKRKGGARSRSAYHGGMHFQQKCPLPTGGASSLPKSRRIT